MQLIISLTDARHRSHSGDKHDLEASQIHTLYGERRREGGEQTEKRRAKSPGAISGYSVYVPYKQEILQD